MKIILIIKQNHSFAQILITRFEKFDQNLLRFCGSYHVYFQSMSCILHIMCLKSALISMQSPISISKCKCDATKYSVLPRIIFAFFLKNIIKHQISNTKKWENLHFKSEIEWSTLMMKCKLTMDLISTSDTNSKNHKEKAKITFFVSGITSLRLFYCLSDLY